MMRLFLALVFCGLAVASSYDADLARRAILYMKIAPCARPAIANWSCAVCQAYFPGTPATLGRVFVLHNATQRTQGFVVHNKTENTIIVSFRGTENLENWLQDFDSTFAPYPMCGNYTSNDVISGKKFTAQRRRSAAQDMDPSTKLGALLTKVVQRAPQATQSNFPTCQVHTGFLEDYQSLRPQMWAAVSALRRSNPKATIRVVGHSLGSAIATHAALELVKTLPPVTLPSGQIVSPVRSLHTMGSPRVGNPVFASWAHLTLNGYNVTSVRLVHQDDLVPKVPLLEMGFEHIPHEVWYPYGHANLTDPKAKNYTVCDDSAVNMEDRDCSDRVILQQVVLDDHNQIMGLTMECNV